MKKKDHIEPDFASAGIDIRTAMLHHVKAHPDWGRRPRYIVWNGKLVWTSFDVAVPEEGRFRLQFLSEPRDPLQGIDVRAEAGAIVLPGGESVQTLRTWHDPRFDESVEYCYTSKSGLLKVWNTYERVWPDGRRTEEKWTGNAGFIADNEPPRSWVFRCSSGPSATPDFDQLIVRFTVFSR